MAEPQAPRGGATRSAELVAGILALVLIALAVVCVIVNSRHHSSYAKDNLLRSQALTVAQEEAVNFTTYDYENLTQSFADVTKLGDANFKKNYDPQEGNAAELIVKAKSMSKGTVQVAAVQNVNATSADLLVGVGVTVVNTASPKGSQYSYKLDVKLVRQNDQWLVDQVNQA